MPHFRLYILRNGGQFALFPTAPWSWEQICVPPSTLVSGDYRKLDLAPPPPAHTGEVIMRHAFGAQGAGRHGWRELLRRRKP